MRRKTLLVVISTIVAGLAACQLTQPQPVPEYNGGMLYMGYCASCHGPTGEGDGPLAGQVVTTMQSLRTIQKRNQGVFPRDELRAIVDGRTLRAAHGTKDMPVWGWYFSRVDNDMRDPGKQTQARIDALVAHLEALQD